MHSTSEPDNSNVLSEGPRLYLTCVLCRHGGVIEYPAGRRDDSGTAIGSFSGRSILGVVCHQCLCENESRYAAEYYIEHGIAVEYIKSTIPYMEACFEHTGSVRVVLREDVARVVDITSLMRRVGNDRTLYSLDYDDNRMFEEAPSYYFFGLPELD